MSDWPAELLADVRLSLVKDIGPRLSQNLRAALGSSQAVFEATREQLLAVDGIGPKLVGRIAAAPTLEDVEAELRLAKRSGIQLVTRSGEHYPASLAEIDDPPQVLYLRGSLLPDDAMAVAMVGTRHATQYGLEQAALLAAGLARAGVTVVSGLARGIDTAVHRGALEAGGRTLAVIAGGLLEITPSENLKLADEVAEHGCLVSEAPPRRPPVAGSFPQRNRLISGLSLGVVVVEADDRSGALITARHAGEQGRDVFAVPGSLASRQSRGCHKLIQDGAKLVMSVDDILGELSHPAAPIPQPDGGELRHAAELALNDVERQVLSAIDTANTQIDDVVVQSGLPVHRVLSTISVLEMRKLIRRVSGTQVVRI
ncbi:DNA-processing protein DprA [Aeoliella sp.]|uniref:DNA-processing protein DprA n=1 Tax=Aeoliella sp. TaxID=2795800 RepID=UPI003CCBC544